MARARDVSVVVERAAPLSEAEGAAWARSWARLAWDAVRRERAAALPQADGDPGDLELDADKRNA